MINPGAVMTVKAESFVKPVQKGHELLNLTCTAFLIEHEPSGKKVMFDLGVRKDWWNLSPVIHKRLGSVIPGLKVDTDVPEILKDNGISLDSICKPLPRKPLSSCLSYQLNQPQSSGRTITGIM